MGEDVRTGNSDQSGRSVEVPALSYESATRWRRFCFGAFVISVSIVLFFLAFNYAVPALKDRVDHLLLDKISLLGARIYPFALGVTGLSYFGIILTARRATHPRASNET